jgi:voltage-gated potassium channel
LTRRKVGDPWLSEHAQMVSSAPSSRFQSLMTLGLARPSAPERHAHQRAEAWRWPVLLALLATIPAFYLELVDQAPAWAPEILYLLGATVLGLALWRVSAATQRPWRHVRRNWLDVVQIAGLLACALLPTSMLSQFSLTMRLAVAALTLIRMVWAIQRLFSRAGVVYLLGLAAAVLALCGVGFYWLDPKVLTVGDGLWLAFTTAATVGYGDMVPSTTASRIFSVFVVLLGFGVLSLVTASIAAMFVEGEERRIEREILHDLHHELRGLRAEVGKLREDLARVQEPARQRLDA